MKMLQGFREWSRGRFLLYGVATLLIGGAIGPCGHKQCQSQCARDNAVGGCAGSCADIVGDLFSFDCNGLKTDFDCN